MKWPRYIPRDLAPGVTFDDHVAFRIHRPDNKQQPVRTHTGQARFPGSFFFELQQGGAKQFQFTSPHPNFVFPAKPRRRNPDHEANIAAWVLFF